MLLPGWPVLCVARVGSLVVARKETKGSGSDADGINDLFAPKVSAVLRQETRMTRESDDADWLPGN